MVVQTFRAKLPLGLGIDTKTDAKSLPPAKLEILQNGTFAERGSIITRNGYDVLDDELDDGTALPSDLAKLFTRAEEIGVVSPTKAYSYATGPEKWIDRGSVVMPHLTTRTAANSTAEQSRVDTCADEGIRLFAWEDATGGIRITVQDTESDTVHVSDYRVSATGTRPRCIAMGGFCFVYYVEASSNSLYSVRVSPTSPRTSAQESPTLVATDIEDNPVAYAITPYSTYGVIAYRTTTGALKVGYLWINGQIGGSGQGNLPDPNTDSTYLTSAVVVDLAVSPEGEIGVVTGVSSSVVGRILNSDLNTATGDEADIFLISQGATISGLTVCCEPTARSGNYHYQVIAQITGAQTWLYYTRQSRFYRDGTNYGAASAVDFYRHTGIAGKAFATDDYVYVPLIQDSPNQPTYFIARVDTKLLVGRFLDGAAGGLTTNWTPSSVYRDGDVFTWATVFRNQLEVETDAATYSDRSIKLVTLDFGPTNYGDWTTLGQSTYFAGAQVWMYDGASPVEQGFGLYPENITAAKSTTSSGSLPTNTTVEYACFWEWYNDAGEREVSTLASGISVSLSGTENTVTLTVPTLSLTNKYTPNRSGVRLLVTRTKGDQTTRFRADNPSSPCWNNPSVDTITFMDVMSDSTLGTRELDYTNIELDHTPLPACKIIASGQDRIFVSGLEDPNLVRATKSHKFGMAASGNDTLDILCDQVGGPVTAITVLDDKLIIFKEDRIFWTDSFGPTNLNTADAWNSPKLVTTDLGCIEPRSVVQTPEGAMFYSKKGIWLLSRQLGLNYIGADVESFNGQNIVAADALHDSYQVRFLTDTGTTLMYDYYFKQWSTFTNHQGMSATVWGDTYVYLRNSGDVWIETPGEYLDGTQGIRMKMRTGWWHWDGMQGEMRVYRMWMLGKFHSDHTIYQRVGRNYQNYWMDTQPWNPADALNSTAWGEGTWGEGVWGGANDTVYQYRANLPFQRCEAIRFEWEIIPSQESPGKGATLNQVEIEIGLEQMGFKLGGSKTIG